MLIRERQKFDTKDGNFGVGELVDLSDVPEDGHNLDGHMLDVQVTKNIVVGKSEHGEDEIELTMQDMVLQKDECDDNDVNKANIGESDDVVDDRVKTVVVGRLHEVSVNKQEGVVETPVPHKNIRMVSDGADAKEGSTQARVGVEIDKHFAEEPYIKGFIQNLKKLEDAYSRCVTNFEITYLLYPNNKKLSELKDKYGRFFKMFGESSPISKSLGVENIKDR